MHGLAGLRARLIGDLCAGAPRHIKSSQRQPGHPGGLRTRADFEHRIPGFHRDFNGIYPFGWRPLRPPAGVRAAPGWHPAPQKASAAASTTRP